MDKTWLSPYGEMFLYKLGITLQFDKPIRLRCESFPLGRVMMEFDQYLFWVARARTWDQASELLTELFFPSGAPINLVYGYLKSLSPEAPFYLFAWELGARCGLAPERIPELYAALEAIQERYEGPLYPVDELERIQTEMRSPQIAKSVRESGIYKGPERVNALVRLLRIRWLREDR